MKFIIATIIIFITAFIGTLYAIIKTVGEYDKAEEEQLRREYFYPDEEEPNENQQ